MLILVSDKNTNGNRKVRYILNWDIHHIPRSVTIMLKKMLVYLLIILIAVCSSNSLYCDYIVQSLMMFLAHKRISVEHIIWLA